MRPVTALAYIATLLLTGCSAAPAGPDSRPGASAPDAGALLAASCTGCHAPGPLAQAAAVAAGEAADQAGPAIPEIRGSSAADIRKALTAFRDGSRRGTVMPRLARGYADAEIELLSRHLGTP